MPENATDERKRMLRLYGAEIVLSPGEEGSNGAVRLALELAERDPKYFMPFQYANPANPRAHYEGTGAEIAEALDRVDVLVAGLGTGGTLMGAGERLRESFPDIVVAAAEPLPGDPVMGLRSLADGYVPPILDVTKLDRKMLVSNEESVRGVRALLDLEGIFAGVSCGAAVHVARKIAEEMDEGVIVTILTDAGWKYISADFWEASDEDLAESMESTSGGSPRRGSLGTRRARECGAAERGLRARPVRGRRGRGVRPGPQRVPSPYHFELEIDPFVWADLNDRDGAQAVFHSHVSSPPRPSRTDVQNIGLWAGQPYLIYTVRTGELAAWRIVDGEIQALPLTWLASAGVER